MMKKSFKVGDLHYFGLDLDHTIVRYHLKPMFELIYNAVATYLSEETRHKVHAKKLMQPYDHTFHAKGLLFDRRRGNIIKLDHTGRVLRAAHGTRQMDRNEVFSTYGPNPHSLFDQIRHFHKDPNYMYFTTFFDTPTALICARLVDCLDTEYKEKRCGSQSPSAESGEGPSAHTKDGEAEDRYDFLPDLFSAFHHNFHYDSFPQNKGLYFPALKADVSKYIHERQDVRDWLTHLRNNMKVRIFLLTNSHADYSNLLLNHAFGEDWRSVFDLMIYYGNKPSFFSDSNPFYALNPTKYREAEVLNRPIELGDQLCQGNVGELTKFFTRLHQQTDNNFWADSSKLTSPIRVAYSGDHIHGDIVAVRHHTNWDTVAIVEEMVDDHYHVLDIQVAELKSEEKEAAPKEKTSNEEVLFSPYLASNRWGSFFTNPYSDPAVSITVDATTGESAVENRLRENKDNNMGSDTNFTETVIATIVTETPETDSNKAFVLTHLADTVITHSTVVVPCLTALIDKETHTMFHKDHKFLVGSSQSNASKQKSAFTNSSQSETFDSYIYMCPEEHKKDVLAHGFHPHLPKAFLR